MGTYSELAALLKRRWFPVALTFLVFGGYVVGKDLATRENNQDAALRAQQNPEG